MPPPPKGKAPTKGAKQILVENASTIKFYLKMVLGACGIYFILSAYSYFANLRFWNFFFNIVVVLIYLGCFQIIKYICRPKYNDHGQLVDPGLDLNMEGGMGEHVKDIIILTSVTHVMAGISDYFWLLLLLLPLRALWLVWTNILGPWFFQEAPQDTKQDDKKRKKQERKIKQYNNF